jgi:hypothetical protein
VLNTELSLRNTFVWTTNTSLSQEEYEGKADFRCTGLVVATMAYRYLERTMEAQNETMTANLKASTAFFLLNSIDSPHRFAGR